jgi:hypothetical protein
MAGGNHAGYEAQGPFSDPGRFAPLLDGLVERCGRGPADLAHAVRSWMIHVHWRARYGLPDDPARAALETNLRDLQSVLFRLGELQVSLGRNRDDLSPLPAGLRLIGNCRHHSLFYAALLRRAGVAARVRCGFASYFLPDHWEDHWVVERWSDTENRWVVSDPQLDDLMVERLEIDFDPLDLPPGVFVSGGEAWLACRAGDDPGRYGIFDWRGWDFVKGNLVRDVSALAGCELLNWDAWGLILKPRSDLNESELASLDAAARATPMQAPLTKEEATALASRPGILLPRRISSWRPGGTVIEVDLGSILGS